MGSGAIPDNALYTYSIFQGHEPRLGRLNNAAGSFCGTGLDSYLGIRFDKLYKITGVSIQGFKNETVDGYVKEFILYYLTRWDQWMWLFEGERVKV